MPNMSNDFENKLLDYLFRGGSFTAPTKVYVGLFTTPCTDKSPGVEVNTPSYTRAEILCNMNAWSATNDPNHTGPSTGVSGVIFNISEIAFPDPQENWGTVSHIGMFTANTGGEYMFWARLTTPRDFVLGDTNIKFKPGELSIQIDN